MNKAIAWMAGNHVAANLLMMVLIVGGIIIGSSAKQEVFPEVLLDRITVQVMYPGAGPSEVEEGIILQIEEGISGIEGIKSITSSALEGVGTVAAELTRDADPDLVLQDIKSEVDRIVSFPGEAEKPVISKVLNKREVISLVLYGDASERVLREQAELIRDELLSLPEITQADLKGVRPYEISVEVSENTLRQHGLTLDAVAARIKSASLDLPAGSVREEGGEILIRTKEKRYDGAGFGAIVIIPKNDGTAVHLSDLATVRDEFRQTDTFAQFNGKPAAMVSVYRIGDQKPTVISQVVRRFIEEKKQSLPSVLSLDAWNDSSEVLESRKNLLIKNALLGLVLVFVILSLFLQMRLALWVMMGIPISFLGTLLLMPSLGVSINMISLFAFIMALGIVVDDAIVIGENIFDHRLQGKPYLQAAIDGSSEVGIPVVFSILTTVAAFLPLVFVEGMLGKFIKVIPIVVITILMVSLAESLFVLPAHLAMGGKGKTANGFGSSPMDRFRRIFVRSLESFINTPYRKTLGLALSFRYATLALAIGTLIVSIGMVKGGLIKFRFMPEVDGDVITASLTMPQGTPVDTTEAISRHIAELGRKVVEDYDRQHASEKSSLRQLFNLVGGRLAPGGPTAASGASGAHLADIAVVLTPSEERAFSSSEITSRWRKAVGELPGIESLTFASNMVRLGANIDVRLAHADTKILAAASRRVKAGLAEYPGVSDIADNNPEGKKELQIKLSPAGRAMGLTETDLGRQIRSAFYGAEALRLQRGRNEVKVMVRYPEDDRQSIWNLKTMRIRTADGSEMPLAAAALAEEGRGYSVINRSDLKRVVNITATVDEQSANAEEIIEVLKSGLLAELTADYPGLTYDLEGEQKERRDSFGSMKKGFILALLAIYALLAIPFRSYSQPLLIMSAIPFGMVGAVLGHLMMGYNLSMLSIFGIVALSGVVVNDSLLLIDKINQNRKDGLDIRASVIEGGVRRFRPILLTSLTTFFGLAPIISETSVQARFLIPMALSLGFGIIFATFITLFLVPSLYLILEDGRRILGLAPVHGSDE